MNKLVKKKRKFIRLTICICSIWCFHDFSFICTLEIRFYVPSGVLRISVNLRIGLIIRDYFHQFICLETNVKK